MNILQTGDGFTVFPLLQQVVGFIELFCNFVVFNHNVKKMGEKILPREFSATARTATAARRREV